MSTATAVKSAFAPSLMLSDFILSEAGNAEMQFESRVAVIYSAYKNIFKSGNRTQLEKVRATVDQYKTEKDARVIVGVKTACAASKRAFGVIVAYRAALDACGIPAVMKNATAEQIDVAATAVAGEFASIVSVALMPEVKAVKTDEEKAAAKAEKEKQAKADARVAEKEFKATVQKEAEKLASFGMPSLADMVKAVTAAIATGALDKSDLEAINSALDSVAANVELIAVDVTEAEPAHA